MLLSKGSLKQDAGTLEALSEAISFHERMQLSSARALRAAKRRYQK